MPKRCPGHRRPIEKGPERAGSTKPLRLEFGSMRPRVLLHGLLALPGLTVLVMYAGSGDGRIPVTSSVADPVLVRRLAAGASDELLEKLGLE